MRKILLGFIYLFIVIGFTTGCMNNNDRFVLITFDDLQEKLEAEESFPLYVGSARCSACAEFQPTLKRVVRNHDFVMYHVDLDTFNEEEQSQFINLFNISATPSLIYIIDGEETSTLNRVVGNVTEAELINSLKSSGYI